jgi:hypothetical protein
VSDWFPAVIPMDELLDHISELPHAYQLMLLDRLVMHVPPSYLQRVVVEMEQRAASRGQGPRTSVHDGHDDDELERHQRQDEPESGHGD